MKHFTIRKDLMKLLYITELYLASGTNGTSVFLRLMMSSQPNASHSRVANGRRKVGVLSELESKFKVVNQGTQPPSLQQSPLLATQGLKSGWQENSPANSPLPVLGVTDILRLET